jgi:acyl carrier protein
MTEANGSDVLANRIRELVSDQLGVDVEELARSASILEDLGADSLDVVELVMAIEEKFDIEIPDEAVEGMRTVGDLETYVTGRVAASPPA